MQILKVVTCPQTLHVDTNSGLALSLTKMYSVISHMSHFDYIANTVNAWGQYTCNVLLLLGGEAGHGSLTPSS